MGSHGSALPKQMARASATGLLAAWSPSLRIVAGYAAFSLIWLTLSDEAAELVAEDERALGRIQALKGLAFIAVTTLALYVILKLTIDSMRDVLQTEAKNADLLRALFQSPALGIIVLDEGGNFLDVNQTFADFLGRTSEELIGMPLNEVTVESEKKQHIYSSRGVRSGLIVEKRFVHEDGTFRWGLVTTAPLQRSDREFAVAVVKDITERIDQEDVLRGTLGRLRQIDEHRRRLLIDLVRAEEAEQQRMANSIHDESMPTMAAAAMTLDVLVEKLDDVEEVALAERAAEQVRISTDRLRAMVFELDSVRIENDDLPAALNQLVNNQLAESKLECELAIDPGLHISPELNLVIYKVVREALLNIVKHARARRVSIAIGEEDNGTKVTIQDDGEGFPLADSASIQQHFGLKQMSDRAQAAGGHLLIRAVPGEGVEVKCWLPRMTLELSG